MEGVNNMSINFDINFEDEKVKNTINVAKKFLNEFCDKARKGQVFTIKGGKSENIYVKIPFKTSELIFSNVHLGADFKYDPWHDGFSDNGFTVSIAIIDSVGKIHFSDMVLYYAGLDPATENVRKFIFSEISDSLNCSRLSDDGKTIGKKITELIENLAVENEAFINDYGFARNDTYKEMCLSYARKDIFTGSHTNLEYDFNKEHEREIPDLTKQILCGEISLNEIAEKYFEEYKESIMFSHWKSIYTDKLVKSGAGIKSWEKELYESINGLNVKNVTLLLEKDGATAVARVPVENLLNRIKRNADMSYDLPYDVKKTLGVAYCDPINNDNILAVKYKGKEVYNKNAVLAKTVSRVKTNRREPNNETLGR